MWTAIQFISWIKTDEVGGTSGEETQQTCANTMKKVNRQCLLNTPYTVSVSKKT